MSLLSGFSVTLPDVELLGQAARAAFAGGAIPAGWDVITPQQFGIPSQYWDGNYFTNNGASAIVLQQGSTWIVSFRGTDGSNDILTISRSRFWHIYQSLPTPAQCRGVECPRWHEFLLYRSKPRWRRHEPNGRHCGLAIWWQIRFGSFRGFRLTQYQHRQRHS